MTLFRLITFICVVPGALFAQQPCLTVTGEQILGSDLAHALPAFSRIPRTAALAPSPLPGGTREFSLLELQSLASRFSIVTELPSSVCFHLATEALNQDRAEQAMRKALPPDARVEILETSTAPVPGSNFEFTRNNLGIPSASDQRTGEIWRGDVIYAGGRRFPVWARVRVTVPVNKLVAVEVLRPGVQIKPSQVRFEMTDGFPQPVAAALSLDEVVGMMPIRSVSTGAELHLDNLTRPNDVNRGDMVQVEVRFGAAHLSLTGKAESAGHIGDMVAIRNPETSKLFQALIQAAGRVLVAPGANEVARSERN